MKGWTRADFERFSDRWSSKRDGPRLIEALTVYIRLRDAETEGR